AVLVEREPRRHVHDRAHAVPLRVHRRELGCALLELLEVDRHLQPAEAERDLHLRLPVLVVLDLEALHARHQLRHLRGVVDHVPDGPRRRLPLLRAADFPLAFPSTWARVAPGSRSISQPRWYGLRESYTIARPAGRSASWMAEQMQWMPPPPPSPMPFAPSGVTGDADSSEPVRSGGTSSAWGTW